MPNEPLTINEVRIESAFRIPALLLNHAAFADNTSMLDYDEGPESSGFAKKGKIFIFIEKAFLIVKQYYILQPGWNAIQIEAIEISRFY